MSWGCPPERAVSTACVAHTGAVCEQALDGGLVEGFCPYYPCMAVSGTGVSVVLFYGSGSVC